MKLLVERQENEALLQGPLKEDRSLWECFLMLAETPRPSHKLDRLRHKLLDLMEAWGLETDSDEAGNIIVRRPATKGYEDAPSIIIQSHMDMVTSANEGVDFDFDTRAIECYVEDDWLKARETTLGSDNGVGLAASLALLRDQTTPMGALECLFTADEETTMGGAEYLAPSPFIKSRIMINVDSEEEEAICVGCAGGFEMTMRLMLSREDHVHPQLIQISYAGFVGGHTGIDIDRGRGSAIIELLRLLDHLRQQYPMQLVKIQAGGAVNTIPRDALATIAIDGIALEALQEECASWLAKVSKLYDPIERQITLDVVALENTKGYSACTQESSNGILDAMLQVPHGALDHLAHARHEVETSISFAILTMEADASDVIAHVFARTSSPFAGKRLEAKLKALGRVMGADVSDSFNNFPAWDPNPKSEALKHVLEVVEQEFQRKPTVYSVHAGPECGFILGKYPDMDCVSIGPDIRNAHTPDEKCNIPSVTRFYRILRKSIQHIQGIHSS